MNIAIFADLHGRLLLAFKVCARWEQETGRKIDLILQAGDLGAFPDLQKADRATLQHAQRDPTELGFSANFVEYDEQVNEVLAKTSCTMVFVRGNHEDHAWLDALEKESVKPLFAVDSYRRVFCLKTGEIFTFQKDSTVLNVLGIGRIASPERSPNASDGIYIQSYERQQLRSLWSVKNQQVDILLTHDKAADMVLREGNREFAGGMPEIRQALNDFRPQYHFFGHIGGPLMQGLDPNKTTTYCKPADFAFNTSDGSGRLEDGSFAILDWLAFQNHSLEIVKADWFKKYTAFNWQYL